MSETVEITVRLDEESLRELSVVAHDAVAVWLEENGDGTYSLVAEEPKDVSGLLRLRASYQGPLARGLIEPEAWLAGKERRRARWRDGYPSDGDSASSHES